MPSTVVKHLAANELRQPTLGAVAQNFRWRDQPWWMLVLAVYASCIPVVAMHLPGVGGVGAADLLMPIGICSLLLLPRVKPIHLSHLALAAFMLAALASLTMIDQKRTALDCLIRWVRLTSIVVPFYFGLFMPISNLQLKRALWIYLGGGFVAVLIGIILYELQIEVRGDQQKLWLDDGFQLRAGGLIGNSGAFGHLTATWCVVAVSALCTLASTKYRFVLAALVLAMTGYTIVAASSRATILHLFAGLSVFAAIYPTALHWRKQFATLAAIALAGSVMLVCISQSIGGVGDRSSDIVNTNLQRFVPGWGGSSVNDFTSNRAENWPEYVAMMSDSWLLGTGYKTGVRMHEESPDNSYLSVMLETGVVGFTCMSLFVISVFYRLIGLYFGGDQFAIVLIPMCVGQLTHCLTSDVYTFWITMPVVYMFLGFGILRDTPGATQ